MPGVGNGGNPGVVGASGRDSLARTTQALQAVRAMQTSARALATSGPNNLGLNPNQPGVQLPNVPNGLTIGGLQVAPGVPANLTQPAPNENPALWQGASLPTQTVANGRTNVDIIQNQQQALLNWQTFNVGRETSVHFDQTAGGQNASQWIAFNKISDPSGVPSQILGSIDALGQVYLINQNGIIFGGSSQINLHTLVASSLPINDNLIARGLLNNPDNQFLFSALALPAGSNGTPAFTPPAASTPDGRYGAVTVQKGAVITSPTTADHVGGRVALIGANVSNDGTISTTDGQTILAAGLQVGFAAHSSSDPSLRGLDTFVGEVGTYGGSVTNSGLIDAPRANVTLTGKAVNQLGFINSSTSVALNGRIDLLASYNAVSNATTSAGLVNLRLPAFLFQSSGIVTLGAESVTQILPELASSERVVGTQLALASQINLRGEIVHFLQDATLLAPSASVVVDAGLWNFYIGGGQLNSQFVFSGGQVYLDPGALIDVSGSAGVSASVAENIIPAQLLGSELANFPLQRNGILRGETVYIDIRQRGTYNGTSYVGTPLADVTGYINLVQRTVGELTIMGGSVRLNAGGSVVLQPGSTIDVSGGSINYEGANVRTTQVTSGGRIYDISEATPDRIYDSIVGQFTESHPKWGIAEDFTSVFPGMHFEPGYTQGGDGGSVSITAPGMVLDGNLNGQTVTGPRQQSTPPIPSALNLTWQKQQATSPFFQTFSPTPPDVIFSSATTLPAAAPFALDADGHPLPLAAERLNQFVFAPSLLTEAGFGRINLDNSDGDILLPADVSLLAPLGGSITLAAANLNILGDISAPGGTINFTVFNISPSVAAVLARTAGSQTPPANADRGNLVVGPNASLSTAGSILDLRGNLFEAVNTPFTSPGGTISLNGYRVDLAAGSLLDVSGGVVVSGSGAVSYGNAGKITIKSGQDATISSVLGGSLSLGAELRGFSGGVGGSLALTAPFVQIGGNIAAPNTLLLAAEFFSEGGFGSFQLSGIGGTSSSAPPAVQIVPGTQIFPVVQSLLAAPQGLGAPLVLSTITQPVGVRAPVNLTFSAPGVRDAFSGVPLVRGDFVMGAGSLISADPRASVSISGNTAAIFGSIYAPGGAINVSGSKSSALLFTDQGHALATVDLAPGSILSTAGTTLLKPDPRNLRIGSVLAGGTIFLSGNIVAEAGALLDVSGATGILDLVPGAVASAAASGSFGGSVFVPTRVDSNGGSIIFSGGQELFIDATLRGGAGGPGATGGTLSVASGRFYDPGIFAFPTPLDILLTVTQNGPTIPASFSGSGPSAIGRAVLAADGSFVPGRGYFAADTFASSGLASLVLAGTVQFSGVVDLQADRSITAASGGVLFANDSVSLAAPYVTLGTTFRPPLNPQELQAPFVVDSQPFYIPPQFGSGSLSVAAKLIDLGNLSLQGVGSANLNAVHGDVRGDGAFDLAGDLSITAGQIYPPSGVSFTLAAYDYSLNGATQPGSITIAGGDLRPLPFAAGGRLNLYSSLITQGGVLRAPQGTINVGWNGTGLAPFDQIAGRNAPIAQQASLLPGSVTSVSAIDPITGKAVTIPYGLVINGTSLIDPSGVDITVGNAPTKSVTVAASNVVDQAGSTIDIRGGGDLFAYQFISGVGGTVDLLNSTGSFAIIPGNDPGYAPFAPYNSASVFGSDRGYLNSTLAVGDQIYLSGGNGLPAGTYTLLPARYALLTGAYLVTPKQTPAQGAVPVADGSQLISGYRFNAFDRPTMTPALSSFEIASSAVVQQRAQYDTFSANEFLRDAALDQGSAVPRLPLDSGQLVLSAIQAMTVEGRLASTALGDGRGGVVDINSPVNILIGRAGTVTGPGILFLDATALSNFGADSLLIGGIRTFSSRGTEVAVSTGGITVDNAGAPLSAPDLTLVAKNSLTLAPGSEITQVGALQGEAGAFFFGNAATAGSGDGVLLRVSSDPTAGISRQSVSASLTPALSVGANSRLTGSAIILDSTSRTTIDPSVQLSGMAVSLSSGKISLALEESGVLPADAGLILSSSILATLQANANALSLLSYSSIDIYGHGALGGLDDAGNPLVESLALHAAEIRGFNNGGSIVSFTAREILLDNSAGRAAGPAGPLGGGTIEFNADTLRLGANQLAINLFDQVRFNVGDELIFSGTGGLTTQGALDVSAPVLTAGTAANQLLSAGGNLTIERSGSAPAILSSGLGAALTLQGASVLLNSDVILPSGSLTAHATGAGGDISVGGTLDVAGTARTFFDLVRYTNGGAINLISDFGSVTTAAGSQLLLDAPAGGGNGGTLSVAAPTGSFTPGGLIRGAGGGEGKNGSFVLDVGQLPQTAALDAALNAAMLDASRSFRVRTGDVTIDGMVHSSDYALSTDTGSIFVSASGTIDGSGATGGEISLRASGSIELQAGSLLTVAAADFDAAGKGGAITLEAGSEINGIIDPAAFLEIGSGAQLDLSVASSSTADAAFGLASGVLHLRAPQTAGATDLQLRPIAGSILGASAIVVEGYALFDLTGTSGVITSAVQNSVRANGTLFASNTATISNRLLASNPGYASILHVRPGAEIINRSGDLTLASDWDLSTYRFGPQKTTTNQFGDSILVGVEPGVLTLRASRDLVFNGALSDGFGDSAGNPTYDFFFNPALWLQPLLPLFTDGTPQQSWSYRLTAGADLAAADFHRVLPQASLAAAAGSVQLGTDAGVNISFPSGPDAVTDTAVAGHYQVIRTGTGDIEVSAARDLNFLNQFATIYTAGTQVSDPTLGGTFDLPQLFNDPDGFFVGYPAQYSSGGGNVSLFAQGNIAHLTRAPSGQLIADSEKQLPTNWLYRRGYVAADGKFGLAKFGDVASTSWWIDFSNFFEGVGALGGGNVSLIAGGNIANVDAVVPTNARMPGRDSATGASLTPDAASLVELGGGDLTVRAGNDIDGGVYYLERGQGTLAAGNSIHTNSTRSPSITTILNLPPLSSETWLPTTLFVGKSSFDVDARGDLLLGPAANPFLLPQGLGNTYFYKTYFSTYSPESEINVASLTGATTLRYSATLPTSGVGAAVPLLQAWYENVDLILPNISSVASYQPWLRIAETNVTPFATALSLFPSTLKAISFSSDLNFVGRINLMPSATGTLELLAAGAFNALQPNGRTSIFGTSTTNWGTASINLSDANPASVYGITSPFAYQGVVGTGPQITQTGSTVLDFFNSLFAETGSTTGAAAVLQTQQALHDTGLLHRDDETPAYLYAAGGDISGLLLFSPKATRIFASRDITDVAFYLQNVNPQDISIVASGRDLVLYDPTSLLRGLAQAVGNALDARSGPLAGDLQIAGPGVLEVLAGRNLDLGVGPNNSDGTGIGLSSVGNARNPALPFGGVDIIGGAGISTTAGLAASDADFDAFIAKFLDPDATGDLAPRYLSELGTLLGLPDGTSSSSVRDAFDGLTPEVQDQLALKIFFLVLRDAGRDHNDPNSLGFGNYANAYTAIATLFPGETQEGNISLTSRGIKTANGGDILLFAPGGALNVGVDATGNLAADQGILTQAGGNISIFTRDNINVGTSRIFTLRGGDEVLFSSLGNIAAGASSKTVQAAPPTRVLIDPQTGDVKTDLAGLATGGGIGVLESVAGVPPSDVDLIAPQGTIDAGDAGIRVSGNLNLAALIVVNAGNIQVGGSSAGVPTVAAPNIGGLTVAANAIGAANNAAIDANQTRGGAAPEAVPSIISVEVLGYGGGGSDDEDEEEKKRRRQQEQNSTAYLQDQRADRQTGGLTDLASNFPDRL